MNGAFYHAIELLPLGLAVSVEFIGPLVLAAVLSRRPIDALRIGLATIGMALIGVEKAFGAEHISTLGLAFALVAGFFWACYILATSRVGRLIDGALRWTEILLLTVASMGITVTSRPNYPQRSHTHPLSRIALFRFTSIRKISTFSHRKEKR